MKNKRRLSAVRMMMVAGGLVAAVPALAADNAVVQCKGKPQNRARTGLVCNGKPQLGAPAKLLCDGKPKVGAHAKLLCNGKPQKGAHTGLVCNAKPQIGAHAGLVCNAKPQKGATLQIKNPSVLNSAPKTGPGVKKTAPPATPK